MTATLTDDEQSQILNYWPTIEDFHAWQRESLAMEIQRRAEQRGLAAARAEVEAAFPSLYPPETGATAHTPV